MRFERCERFQVVLASVGIIGYALGFPRCPQLLVMPWVQILSSLFCAPPPSLSDQQGNFPSDLGVVILVGVDPHTEGLVRPPDGVVPREFQGQTPLGAFLPIWRREGLASGGKQVYWLDKRGRRGCVRVSCADPRGKVFGGGAKEVGKGADPRRLPC